MKNSEIHDRFDRKEIRNFLSMSIVKLFEEQLGNKKQSFPYTKNDPFGWSIRDSEAKIENLKKDIQITRSKQAIAQLIESNGWQEFDVSDETEKDLPETFKMNFIGTQEEYEFLLLLINGE